ncbi:ATP synthase delta chain, chloroplastic [Hevea brasiliensis]|nr:ATP synthase delta chain, chloroplastic [Hevea brasiliensis]
MKDLVYFPPFLCFFSERDVGKIFPHLFHKIQNCNLLLRHFSPVSMDTLSSSVSTLKVPALYSAPREFYHFKTLSTSHQLPPHLTTKHNSISNKTTVQSFYLKTLNSPQSCTSQSSSLKSSPNIHLNPASGYAAALLDVAQCNNSLETVQRDVERLLKLLQSEQAQAVLANPLVGEKNKGQLVNELAKKGKMNRLLVRLLKMLIERNKVIMVIEVLMEFQRIYDELSGTKVVLVSSQKKMEDDELFGIARSVLKLSGAMKVRVKNLFGVNGEKLPSFAM